MKYEVSEAIQVLEKTPKLLHTLLSGLNKPWIINNEGPDSFSPFDIVGHLLHGEKTDWPGRIRMILDHGSTQTFIPYDRFAMFEESKGKSIDTLLDEFAIIRKENIVWLNALNISSTDLEKLGNHPTFGTVTLKQLLATWVVHDLTHLSQTTRVMAKQYKEEIGPWAEFFRILTF